jgi:DNA-binding response OmpR family regulator
MIIFDGCATSGIGEALAGAGYQVMTVRGLEAALAQFGKYKDGQPALLIVCGTAATGVYMILRGATRAAILALLTEPTETETLNVLAAGADDCQPATIGEQEAVLRARILLRSRQG